MNKASCSGLRSVRPLAAPWPAMRAWWSWVWRAISSARSREYAPPLALSCIRSTRYSNKAMPMHLKDTDSKLSPERALEQLRRIQYH